ADENGRATHPSIFWGELQRLCPGAAIARIARPAQGDPDAIGTPRQLVTALMRWARDGGANTGPWPALYQWLADPDRRHNTVDLIRLRAWKALAYTNAASLSPATISQLFPSPLQAASAQIESFAACPFQHFLRYGLHLHEREVAD